jgi:hypothetical protein
LTLGSGDRRPGSAPLAPLALANPGNAGESGAIRIGTKGTQKKAFLAGVSGKSISGASQPVLINGQGQLGTAAAASAKANGGSQPLSAVAGTRLLAEVNRLQRQNKGQGQEIRALSAGNG